MKKKKKRKKKPAYASLSLASDSGTQTYESTYDFYSFRHFMNLIKHLN